MGVQSFNRADPLSTATSFLSQDVKDKENLSINQQINLVESARTQLKIFLHDLMKNPKGLNEKKVAELNHIMFLLHEAKGVEESKLNKVIYKCLDTILIIFTPDTERFPKNSEVFDYLLTNILSDVSEETIGQERIEEAMPNLVEKFLSGERFSKDHIDTEMMDHYKQVAALFYPLAILTAHFDPRSKIPDASNEKYELERDVKQFEAEYNHQFKNKKLYEKIKKYWKPQQFSKILKEEWSLKKQEM